MESSPDDGSVVMVKDVSSMSSGSAGEQEASSPATDLGFINVRTPGYGDFGKPATLVLQNGLEYNGYSFGADRNVIDEDCSLLSVYHVHLVSVFFFNFH